MTEVMNLLDLPCDVLTKIGDYVNEEGYYIYKTDLDFNRYDIDIDLDVWNQDNRYLNVDEDEDSCYDKLHENIDNYVTNTSLKEIEKLVYNYGFSKAIKLYNDTYGITTDNLDNNPEMFVRKLAYCIIKEFIYIVNN
jgi:hypothetical protein